MKLLLLLVIGLILLTGTATATVYYVDTDGSGDYDCDGTDDHVQIQWAIDNASSGDTVHLNTSVYLPNGTIYFNSTDVNIIFEGDGVSNTEIKYTYHPTFDYFHIQDTDNITIMDMKIYSNDTGFIGTNHGHGIRTDDSQYIYFSGLDIQRVYRAFGAMDNTEYVYIDDNNISYNRGGWRPTNVSYAWVTNNTFHHMINAPGIYFNYPNLNITIDNNTFYNNFASGIATYTNPTNTVLSNNTIYSHSSYGIDIYNTFNNIIIRDNDITTSGIGIRIHPYQSNYLTILRNKIYNNDNGGISFTNKTIQSGDVNTTISGNIIDNNGGDGILELAPSMGQIDICLNIITNNGGAGINGTIGAFYSTYNDIWNNTGGSYAGTVNDKTGDISFDPLFYNVSVNDFHLNSTVGTWNGTGWQNMLADSPCIDAGDSSSDYSNEPSPNGGIINIGLYGNTVYASKSSWVVGNAIYLGRKCQIDTTGTITQLDTVLQTDTNLSGIFNMVGT